MAEIFRSVFTENDLVDGDTAIVSGQYNKLGEYRVKAGETITLGWGAGGMDSAVGRIYGILKDDANVELKGKVRFSIWSPQDRPMKIMQELHTSSLNTSSSDKTKQTPFNERNEIITEDKKIVMEFLPENVGSGTLSISNSDLIMDITQGVV